MSFNIFNDENYESAPKHEHRWEEHYTPELNADGIITNTTVCLRCIVRGCGEMKDFRDDSRFNGKRLEEVLSFKEGTVLE